MRIEHKNCLSGYVSEWLNMMNIKARAEGNPSSGLTVPQPAKSLSRNEFNLCIMLELFDERITRNEKLISGEKADCDFVAYSEAMCFLDSIYFISGSTPIKLVDFQAAKACFTFNAKYFES